jgi:hypothetical protein
LLSLSCSRPPSTETTTVVVQALTETRRVTFTLPAGVDFRSVAVGANGTLNVGDRAEILTASAGFALSTNAGITTTALSDYGVESKVGAVTSNAAVTLRDRARVTGSVVSGRTVTKRTGAVVTGTTTQNAVLTPVQQLSWTVPFELSTTDVTRSTGQSVTLAPGAYRNVTAFGTATISLAAGVYYFERLDIEPQASLILANNGPVTIYVRTSLIIRGSMSGAAPENLLFTFLGTEEPALEKSFNATIVAPNATVRLAVGGVTHSGAVLAKGVTIEPNVKFTFRLFSGWDVIPFNVIPVLSCAEQRPDGSWGALLGYYNPNRAPVTVPIGANNRFVPNPQSHGQPTTFLPGRLPTNFGIDFGTATSLTWQLQGSSLVVARTAPACVRSATFNGAADTTVAEATPRANFGFDARLKVGPGSHALIQFDRAAAKQQLGAGRLVTKATLQFTFAAGAKPPLEALGMARSRWTDLDATWNCAEDTLVGPNEESCAPGTAWNLARSDGDDDADTVPWRVRGDDPPVLGVWSGTQLSFDVTRDAQDLLGADGLLRGLSWIVTIQPGATGTVELGSLQSATKPRLIVESWALPEVVPDGRGPLRFTVDATLPPPHPLALPFADGVARPVVALADSRGEQSAFVANELVVQAQSSAELGAVASRWGGVVLDETTLSPEVQGPKTFGLVRVDSSRGRPDTLVPRLRAADNRVVGNHRISSASGLATMAIAAEEAERGTRVKLNSLVSTSTPTTQQWVDRQILDGEPVNPDFDAGRNPFQWPAFSSCNFTLVDPSDPFQGGSCATTMPNGDSIFQHFGVADAWRALALTGRLIPGSIHVGTTDNSYFPDQEYPSFATNQVLFTPNRLEPEDDPFHGDTMVRMGFGVAGNEFGGAGPGGPVAHLEAIRIYGETLYELERAIQYARGQFGMRLVFAPIRMHISASETIFTGVDTSHNSGTPLFASAGNSGIDVDEDDCIHYIVGKTCWEAASHEPCENDGVTCIGGFTFNGTGRQGGSNWGSKDSVDYGGPWFYFNSPWSDGFTPPPDPLPTGYDRKQGGTSGASAYIAGVSSLVFAADPSTSVKRMRDCMKAGSDRIGFGPRGHIRVPNAFEMVSCMLTGEVDGNLPPHVEILNPADGITVPRGTLVQVRGFATDYEAGKLTVSWISNIDGGVGASFSEQFGWVIFSTLGTHTLTARATAPGNPGQPSQVATDTITVNVVEAAPTVRIVTPGADGQTFLPGSIRLTAEGSRFGLALPPASAFTWRSEHRDGTLDFEGVVGNPVFQSITSQGEHKVSVTFVSPISGLSVTASRTLNISSSGVRRVDIVSPPPDGDGFARLDWDKAASLVANANFAVDRYEWRLLIAGISDPLIATGNNASWRPDSELGFSCQGVNGLLELRAIDATGFTVFDFAPVIIVPGFDQEAIHCVR